MSVRDNYKRLWTREGDFYRAMIRRHQTLWKFLKAFVTMNDPGKMPIIEVGGGAGDVSEWAKGRYINIERNRAIIEVGKEKYPGAKFIHDDFVHMDTRQFQSKNYALLMAAAVVEHCPGYQLFILRALDVNALIILITFFRGLLWEKDNIQKVISPEAVYYENHYSGRQMDEWLTDMGLCHQFYALPRKGGKDVSEVILIIDTHKSMPEQWWFDIDSLGFTRRGYGEWRRKEWEEKMAELRQEKKDREAKSLADARALNPEVVQLPRPSTDS